MYQSFPGMKPDWLRGLVMEISVVFMEMLVSQSQIAKSKKISKKKSTMITAN
jgi:hypothetical protein